MLGHGFGERVLFSDLEAGQVGLAQERWPRCRTLLHDQAVHGGHANSEERWRREEVESGGHQSACIRRDSSEASVRGQFQGVPTRAGLAQ